MEHPSIVASGSRVEQGIREPIIGGAEKRGWELAGTREAGRVVAGRER
jgi:hypothetical protein